MDRLHELFCLLDRLEQLVAPEKKCICTVQDKFSKECIYHQKNSSESLSSFEKAIAQSCQCNKKAANSKSIVYHNSAAQMTEVCNEQE